MLNVSPQDDLDRFDRLHQALLDASSIIYMGRAGFLHTLSASIELFSIGEVLSEVGRPYTYIQAVSYNGTSSSTDQRLISCAIDLNLAVIAEDKKILKAMQHADRPFFNSLMMLNFLLYYRQISDHQYDRYHMQLKKIARYSEDVWTYGASVKSAVNKSLGGVYGR